MPPEAILGVGVGVPAVLNAARDVVVASSHLGWRDVPLMELLRQRLGVSVCIDNAVKMATLGELRRGIGKDVEHLAYCSFGTGV
uniref:ROK family protein n=1 Tax=Bartonella sp. CL29QHWL TaxID=3243522 RepID=UPI0035CFBE73